MSAGAQPAIEDVVRGVVAEGIKNLKADFEGKSHEQQTALLKTLTDTTLPEMIEKAVGKWGDEYKAEVNRTIAQRTARPPAGFGAGSDAADLRTLGQQFGESEQFKAWAANDRTRDRLSITLKGRVLTPTQFKAITIAGSGVTISKYHAPTVLPVQQRLVMRDLLPTTPITSNAIEYQKIAWTGTADYQVAEGDKKAELSATYTPATASVRTIAGFVKVSRQMLADVPAFSSTVDNRLLYEIAYKEDKEILYGDNAAGHLNGIMPQAPALGGTVISSQTTPADQLLAAVAYLASLGYPPTGMVLNPLDWASLQSQKLTNGAYLLGGPPASFPPNSLWGLPVVLTNTMVKGSFLVGAFNIGAELFDREAASVDVAFENEDDFVKNMVTIRAEERIALAVYVPTAFVKSTFTFPAMAEATEEPTRGSKK